MVKTETLIIGASVAGLAVAASLNKKGRDYLVIEKEKQVATPWRNHYDRLHLHTSKRFSHLPYKKFGKELPRYPAKQQVLKYLEDYQKDFQIEPVFETQALDVQKEGGHWITITNKNSYRSDYLVMATGAYGRPRDLQVEGMDEFSGRIVHSSEYKSGFGFRGQKVLVIGFGNSACEIAIDLYEQGAVPFMTLRSPVNVLPRDLLGIPIQEWSLFLRGLPSRVADRISAPLIRGVLGELGSLGIKKMPYGPLEQIQREGKAPVLDIGTIRLIREGHIRVLPEIEKMAGSFIYFRGGLKEEFSEVISCIGYEFNKAGFLHVEKNRMDDLRYGTDRQAFFGKEGLYFCGYHISPTGQIREISLDAKKIAGDIAKR